MLPAPSHVVPRQIHTILLALAVVVAVAPAVPAPPAGAQGTSATTVTALLVDGLADPLGIDGDAPRLSWQLAADRRGVSQVAYQVRAASTVEALAAPDVWDSGRVESDQQVDVGWGGPPLASATRYHWQVRIWDDTGTASPWSDPAWFETGMLSPEDWTAEWIGGVDTSTIGPEWTDVTIAFTGSAIDGALGIYLRGRDDANAYMWQLSESENALRPHVKSGGGYTVLPATPFPAGFDWAAPHRYEVTVSGTTITTRVDGSVLDTRTDATHTAPGIMGFRTSGAERGVVDDLTVTASDGTTLVATDFSDDDVTFRAGTVHDQALHVSGNAEAWLVRPDPVPLMRTEFTATDVVAARLYASARGVYELRLNGQPVGDHELAPGWTDYRTRIQHQTYDVTSLIQPGGNALGAELADGWFAGHVAMFGPNQYGRDTSLIAELHLTRADGSTQVVGTDGTWRTTGGSRTAADLLHGESVDGRRAAALAGWDQPGHDITGWDAALVRQSATDRLEPQTDQPVRVTQELAATYLSSPAPGTWIYDLGQNMVGKVRVTLQGQPGDTVRLRHAEVLNPDGTMYTANLRSARATDTYTLATDGPETFSPEFTFHGFRYVEIAGVAERPDASEVVGVVMGTDGPLVGQLDTSSDLVDQLHSNITWGMRGNFLSIPTDTPARDERMGWTGDINVFARTAVYGMDAQAFLAKWLQDLRDTQRSDGALPGVAPVVPGAFDGGYGSAGWMDAGVNVPWTLWQAYGDTAVITENLDMMTRYVEYLRSTSNGGIRSVGGYNDWLNLDDHTPHEVIDTAFVAKSARQLSQMAAAIGEEEIAARYAQLYEEVRAAYISTFVAADGTVRGDSQTAYILTITNDLVPEDRREALTQAFIETIERRDWHLSTGFLGVDGLLPALTAVGRTDVAYRLLQNTDYPSWGYEIGHGATTIWERWNSIMPDGSFGPVGMNSFNHYAYGAVGEWMYRTMAGVSALEPGYRTTLIAPQPGAGLDAVDFTHETRYGTVRSAWQRTAQGLDMQVEVPAGTTAVVRVPAPSRGAVAEGGIPAEEATGVTFVDFAGGHVTYEVGSGRYAFSVDPVLGDLGAAAAGVDALRTVVEDLVRTGSIDDATADQLDRRVTRLASEVADARTAYLAGDATAAEEVHRALGTADALNRWVQTHRDRRITGGDADRLVAGVEIVTGHLSAVSAVLVGAVARVVVPAEEVYAGATVPVDVIVDNAGEQDLEQLAVSLQAPAGWALTQVGQAPNSVPAGGTATASYEAVVPDDAPPGTVRITGSVSYRYDAGTATLPVAADIHVGAAVQVGAVVADPSSLTPGNTTVVTATLHNRGTVPTSRTVTFAAPDGWATPAPQTVQVPAGGEATATTIVEVPLEVTEGPAPITAAVGQTAGELGRGAVDVVLINPPAITTDHVDLGDPSSEQAHGLTASSASGTSTEAGMTRRYTNATQPGGWFEFDLVVPRGEPFVIRAIETYDGPQLKDYTISVDGQVVHERAHRRSASGHGTVTHQFLVDPSDATADGRVRVRYDDTGSGYDPSIADVWAMPAIDGLDAVEVAPGAAVTARTSTERAPDWSRVNLTDGLRRSRAGGAKGYSSTATTTRTAVEWVALDLGTPSLVDAVVLYPRTQTSDDVPTDEADGAHFPRDYTVEVSDDGVTWKAIAQVLDQPDPGATPVRVAFDPVTTRHVRIHVTELGRPTVADGLLGRYRLQLAELDVLRTG